MSWFASLGIAFLTAVAGGFISGYIASLYVDWYHVSGREGASGYFIVAMFILGGIIGGVVGLVASRVVAAGAHPGALRALGLSLAVVVGAGAIALGLTRALADIPPTIDGEELMLAVQVRWPEGSTASPADVPEKGSLSLGSVPRFSHTQRASVNGVLLKADARLEDGRWVVPGAVSIFTSRGTRTLLISPDEKSHVGFLVPLPGHPGAKDHEWSDWLPRQRPGAPPATGQFTYRYRAQKESEPIRTQTEGPFEILSSIRGFYNSGMENTESAWTAFSIRYQGKPVVIEGPQGRFERGDAVALVAGAVPSLVVHVDDEATSGFNWLLTAEGDSVRTDFITQTGLPILAEEVTSDSAQFAYAKKRQAVRGWIDRTTFDHPGIYLMGGAAIDTRRHVTHPVKYEDEDISWVSGVPPLGLSPDERSFIRFGYAEHSEDHPALVAVDAVGGSSSILPIDRARMHYTNFYALDPTWVAHHFEWKKGPDGVDRLSERKGFVPIPWKGILSADNDGPSYRVEPGGEPMRAAIVAFLLEDFKAEPLPADSGSYRQSVRINGQQVNVSYYDMGDYLTVEMEHGSTDSSVIAEIAKRFDAVLATGKYDALFTTK